MIHPSETDTADVNEFGAVRIPEEILRKLGDSIRLVVKKQKSIQEDQPKESPGLTKPFRIPTMQFVTE